MLKLMANNGAMGGFGDTQKTLLRLLLRNKNGLTVDAIARALGVTRTAVNQHLAALEHGGYVMRKDVISTGGRPGRIFALSEFGIELFPKQYGLFSLKTFEVVKKTLGKEEANRLLDTLGAELGGELGAKLKDLPLDRRIREIEIAMQELGFDAQCQLDADAEAPPEAPSEAPSIVAHNCVYHSLAQADPDICRLDLALLRTASHADVEHVSCMAKGDNACKFFFKAHPASN